MHFRLSKLLNIVPRLGFSFIILYSKGFHSTFCSEQGELNQIRYIQKKKTHVCANCLHPPQKKKKNIDTGPGIDKRILIHFLLKIPTQTLGVEERTLWKKVIINISVKSTSQYLVLI